MESIFKVNSSGHFFRKQKTALSRPCRRSRLPNKSRDLMSQTQQTALSTPARRSGLPQNQKSNLFRKEKALSTTFRRSELPKIKHIFQKNKRTLFHIFSGRSALCARLKRRKPHAPQASCAAGLPLSQSQREFAGVSLSMGP